MKIKVGQWVRTKNGHIQTFKEHDVKPYKLNGSLAFDTREIDSATIIKVRDTPQELTQVDDLIFGTNIYDEDLNGPVKVLDIEFLKDSDQYTEILSVNGKWSATEYKRITKILTPNSKGGYDKQWEVL